MSLMALQSNRGQIPRNSHHHNNLFTAFELHQDLIIMAASISAY